MADLVHRASTELAAIVPEYWSSRYYDVLLQGLAFSPLIAKDYEGEISSLGDTLHIASYPEFAAASDMVEDATNDADAIDYCRLAA
jgi:hypothetical protein